MEKPNISKPPVLRHYKDLGAADKKLFDNFFTECSQFKPEEIKKHVSELSNRGLLYVRINSGDTPLHLVCSEGLEALALEMIHQGARLDVKNNTTGTPLHIALEKGLERTALEMIKCGAPLGSTDSLKRSPLHIALTKGLERPAFEMIHQGALIATRDKNRKTAYNNSIPGGLVEPLVYFCILPVYILEGNGRLEPDTIDNLSKIIESRLFPEPLAPKTPDELVALNEKSPFMQDYFRPIRLLRTWRHPTIVFPQELRPLSGLLRFWKPLISDVKLDGGLTLTCLTSTAMLKEEGKQQNNCLEYSDRFPRMCCAINDEERTHILSIRGKDNKPLSTLDINVLKTKKDKDDIPIGKTGKFLHVLMHEGHKMGGIISPPPEAIKAWEECCKRIASGDITLETDPKKLGEIQSSKHTSQYPDLYEQIGYVPSWEQASRCFDEFRRADRRATLDCPESRKRVYDDIETEDGIRQSHFIQGYTLVNADRTPTGKWALHKEQLKPEQGQTIIDLRRLSLRSWMRATGVLQAIQKLAGKEPEVDNSALTLCQTPEELQATRHNLRGVEARSGGREKTKPYFQR